MTGTLGASSSLRPEGLTTSQLRPSQSSLRPQTSPSGQSPAAQNFQGHGMLRVPSMGSPGAPSPATSQSSQLQNQPMAFFRKPRETSFANAITSTPNGPSVISAKIPYPSATSTQHT